MAVPLDHTVIHLSLLQVLTYTNQVYNRLIATGYANLVQQAVLGFPSTPETSNKKGHILCKAEVKTENPNRTSSSPKPSPEPFRKPHANRRVFYLEEAARARNAALQKPSKPSPTSTPTKSSSLAQPIRQTKSLSLAQPISPNSFDTIVEQHTQTNEEAHKVSQDAIDPDTQAYSDDDLLDIRDEDGTNLLLPNAKAETTSSPPPSHPSATSSPPPSHPTNKKSSPSSCNPNESVPPHVQTNITLTSAETASPDQAKAPPPPPISNPPEELSLIHI